MNYIITGGTGFIGTHLTNLIKERQPDAQVYNLDIVKPGTPNPVVKNYKPAVKEGQTLQSTYVECDVRKPIENLPFTPTTDDIIFNFAAVHRTPGHEDHEYFETNIRGAENVIAFAEKYGIKKIVFTSSIAPYGAAEELKKETTLPTPNTAYGISKLVAEKIHMMWQNGDAANRQLTIVRPGVVFGKGENGNFTRLYWAIRGHKFAYPGRKDTIKACIYVKELVRFMLWSISNTDYTDEIEKNNKNTRVVCSLSSKANEVEPISPVSEQAPTAATGPTSMQQAASACNSSENIASLKNMPYCPEETQNIKPKTQNAHGVQLYNCCFEPAYTIQHIVESMKKVTGLTQYVPDIPNWLIMPAAAVIGAMGAPMGICPARVKKLQISTNICGEKLKNSGYQFKWTFEEALADWFEDNDKKGLQ